VKALLFVWHQHHSATSQLHQQRHMSFPIEDKMDGWLAKQNSPLTVFAHHETLWYAFHSNHNPYYKAFSKHHQSS
jgi:hypothetical protein